MIIAPKIRGFICLTAHPQGCESNVAEQITLVKSRGSIANAPKNVLVLGSSTGYGLATRITAAFGGGASTIGVAFEKAPEPDRCASAGWYNTAAFEKAAQKAGLYAKSFNGDAFSDAMKAQVIAAIRSDWGRVDALVYSLASPRRTHPKTGEQFRSVLKPVGHEFSAKSLDTDRKQVLDVTLPPASEDEIRQTIRVMGGEDWEMWVATLKKEGLLSRGFVTTAYSYIGPEVTWPIYKEGTIGKAKTDLERATKAINDSILETGGKSYVSVLKAIVSQASSAIPVVPLYLSVLMRVMKEAGNHEGPIEQIDRLWRSLAAANPFGSAESPKQGVVLKGFNVMPVVGLNLDKEGRVRIDNFEMERSIQEQVKKIWPLINTGNLEVLTDFEGYQAEFLKLFGFGLKGINYTAEADPMVQIPSIPAQEIKA
jgi:enoyl-[acyl-carrier protein] reductase/trans-2-enoyl-CoA reductase (NAD+)